MWSLVDDGLRSAIRKHPEVGSKLASLENEVLAGTTTPTAAAAKILESLKVGQGPP